MTETLIRWVARRRRDKAHNHGLKEGVVKVVQVHPESLRTGQIEGGVKRETGAKEE